MYTKGIRKIFTSNAAGKTLNEVQEMAVNAGFEVLSHNGLIYVRLTKKSWIETSLSISDFEVKL